MKGGDLVPYDTFYLTNKQIKQSKLNYFKRNLRYAHSLALHHLRGPIYFRKIDKIGMGGEIRDVSHNWLLGLTRISY